jgi:hypothetical protein
VWNLVAHIEGGTQLEAALPAHASKYTMRLLLHV